MKWGTLQQGINSKALILNQCISCSILCKFVQPITMISIFSSKKFLVDLLDGFIDIHNHILPGIDDGAQTPEDSIKLLQGFSEFGVNHFIATPHIMHNYYENTSETIRASSDELNAVLLSNNLSSIKLRLAAEHMIDSNFENLLEQKLIMPLDRFNILIEMSYLQSPINFNEAIKAITQQSLFPVLAHPERYNFLMNKTHKYLEFKKQGILFQLNMLSLGDYYGKEISKMAFKLLEAGMIDFIGSDVHNLNQLQALKKIKLSKKTLDMLQPIILKTNETFLF